MLFIAHADCKIDSEVVARMFVQPVRMYLGGADRKGILQFHLPELLSCFVYRFFVISRNKTEKLQEL
jgi:hypothetical protein